VTAVTGVTAVMMMIVPVVRTPKEMADLLPVKMIQLAVSYGIAVLIENVVFAVRQIQVL